MNPEQLQQKIAEYYSKLPEKMQAVFSKMEWLERVRGISERYNLTETQIETLGTETSLVMLGIIHPDEYEQNLMTELAMPREMALKLIDDINLEVMKEWREVLGETFEKNAVEMANKEYGNGKTVDERLGSLPQDVKDVISTLDYKGILLEIGKKNGLNIELLGMLDNITTKMMLGTIHPEEYEKKIIEMTGLPNEKVKIIADEVNDKILKNIRQKLIAHTESVKRVEQPAPSIPIPPVKKEIPNIVPLPPKADKPIMATVPLPPKPIQNTIPIAPATLPTNSDGGILNTAGIELIKDKVVSPSQSLKPMSSDEAPHSADKYREEI